MVMRTHQHADAEHGHTARRPGASTAGVLRALGVRLGLTLLGAAGLVAGALLEWTGGLSGTELLFRVFYRTAFVPHEFATSAGFAVIGLGLLAVVGLALRFGWMTRLAGALGVAAFALVLVQLVRAEGISLPAGIGWGLWAILAGGVIAVVAGYAAAPAVGETRVSAAAAEGSRGEGRSAVAGPGRPAGR